MNNFTKALKILLQQGPIELFTKIANKVKQRNRSKRYLLFLEKVDDKEDTKRERARYFQFRPKISIIIPAYNTHGKWLRLCIESVINQVYDNWELCIVDGGSTLPHVKEILKDSHRILCSD